ncbi:MAG TPA: glycosyltransferase family 4 protein [Balneolaceae bacterium]|nr:glycosyltransferase family 4 protein [Balneolaceae bacterium]
MVKVCFAIHSLQPGGTERVVAELIDYFVEKKKVETHLLLFGKSRKIFYPLNASVIIHKPDFSFDSDWRFYSTLRTLWYIRKQVQQIEPDVILSMGEYWNSFVLLSLYGLKYPVYISERCRPDKNLGRVHENLRRWLYPHASGIIAQTNFAKQIYQKKAFNNNIRVIGNPIYQIPHNGEPQERENIILTVGRLIETKHHDRLIKIFKKISPAGWKLVIVGGNALKQEGLEKLKKLIADLNMEEVVELTGTVSDVEKYYLKSKIFAFTSSSEGFPNVIGEAMSAGLPVIAYDCKAGPSEMIKDGENGFLIPLFDDKLYSKKLSRLLNDEELRVRMGEAAKEAIKKFSIDKIGEQYYSFITDLG